MDFYLKIGSTEVISAQLITDLAAADPEAKKKAQHILSERLKETRVRIGTLLKTDNVSFLFGAGSSMKAGGVGLASIPPELEKDLHRRAAESAATGGNLDWLLLFYATVSALTGNNYVLGERQTALEGVNNETQKIPLNLEHYLSNLYIWKESMSQFATAMTLNLVSVGQLGLSRPILDRLILEIKRSLTSLVNLPRVGKEATLRDHRRLIKKTLTRPLNLRRANLFTLNYDTLIEKAADAEGAVLVDGFVGNIKRIFRPEAFDLDFYFPAQTTEGRVHRFDRALHLYKLHGSINWHRCAADWENPYGVFATYFNQDSADDDVLIFPSPLKYGQALGLPFSELFRRFGSTIAQPQSVLFAIGYGFGDEHVNALIRQALAIPSFTLVVVDPNPTSEFVNHLKEYGDERVWLVNGSQLGTFECFVEKLLPDLREEEIMIRVMKTYNGLAFQSDNTGSVTEDADDN